MHPNVHLLDHSLIARAVTVLRDRNTSVVEFRAHVRAVARGLAFQATQRLPLVPVEVETPLANTTGAQLRDSVIAAPILRAGLGMLDGFLDVLPDAITGFIGMKRDDETLEPYECYRNISDLTNAHLFLLDPMLATGGSARAAMRSLPLDRAASHSLLAIIAAPEGIAATLAEFPSLQIYVAAVDERLNEIGYIVPGLGDAGDRLCHTL
ncbi:MAG: uracil phosphoribosyltransferase [Armatimonadetes bacterium]|nr:uracil phosphoribosyltransferase [Armatimonadota bacterium]